MEPTTQRDFLERWAPGKYVHISDASTIPHSGRLMLATPDIELHCTKCAGLRFFSYIGNPKSIDKDESFNYFLGYICRNCEATGKTFAVRGRFDSAAGAWSLAKYGEEPAFGPPTPPRVISLIGPDREAFLKGRRCENQGLGVGAFVYYRRVVENQKSRIFDEVIRVSKHLGSDAALLAQLEAAKGETQFTKAVDSIRQAIPQSLLINGHNPLLLLHSALSEGVHALSDERCLELASSIRIVLVEFADRLAQAMKDEAELNSAVGRLLSHKAASAPAAAAAPTSAKPD